MGVALYGLEQVNSMDHITEDLLERYAMGTLPEAEQVPLEEHLLVCAFCQDRLQIEDDFIAGLRTMVANGARRANP
jgi:hypothetical protein